MDDVPCNYFLNMKLTGSSLVIICNPIFYRSISGVFRERGKKATAPNRYETSTKCNKKSLRRQNSCFQQLLYKKKRSSHCFGNQNKQIFIHKTKRTLCCYGDQQGKCSSSMLCSLPLFSPKNELIYSQTSVFEHDSFWKAVQNRFVRKPKHIFPLQMM